MVIKDPNLVPQEVPVVRESLFDISLSPALMHPFSLNCDIAESCDHTHGTYGANVPEQLATQPEHPRGGVSVVNKKNDWCSSAKVKTIGTLWVNLS